ncbi:hypothetical protein [Actinophytocola sp. NPDC049390]|uniref:hypothetical protein n=1 Tax=Actinophytocola sp. NPDC049390 TaxID=3363894 RepID=UPI0037A82643
MDENNTRQTYLALRFAMLLLTAMLAVSIVLQVVAADDFCFLHSISAYYHSAVRNVFVGALCAIGACLIVYRGNIDEENVALDYSGFMAFVVAFVPTEYDRACSLADGPRPSDTDIADAAANNVLALLVIALAAVLAAWRLPWLRPDPDRPLGRFARTAVAVTVGLLVVGFAVFFLERDLFVRHGHAVAAVLLFAGIIAVVVFNARDFAAKRAVSLWRNRYSVMAVAMTLSVVGSVVLYLLGMRYAVLIAEALLIGEFAVFWGMQTAELRNRTVRPAEPHRG